MDWYSWLSKTALDPSLAYEYGLAFSRNELQKEDLPYLNHEFLQSMGISVAKHRLEILKLARKEVIGEAAAPNNNNRLSSKLVSAFNKTRKCLNKYVNKMVHHDQNAIKPLPVPEPIRYRDQLKGALMTTKCKSEKEVMRVEQPVRRTSKKIAKSGPLDYRGQKEKLLLAPPRSLKLSGPLDRKTQEKYNLVFNNQRSPVKSGPIDIAIAQQRLMLPNKLSSGPLYNYVRPPSPKLHGGEYYNKDGKEAAGVDYGDHTLWAAMFQDLKPT